MAALLAKRPAVVMHNLFPPVQRVGAAPPAIKRSGVAGNDGRQEAANVIAGSPETPEGAALAVWVPGRQNARARRRPQTLSVSGDPVRPAHGGAARVKGCAHTPAYATKVRRALDVTQHTSCKLSQKELSSMMRQARAATLCYGSAPALHGEPDAGKQRTSARSTVKWHG